MWEYKIRRQKAVNITRMIKKLNYKYKTSSKIDKFGVGGM